QHAPFLPGVPMLRRFALALTALAALASCQPPEGGEALELATSTQPLTYRVANLPAGREQHASVLLSDGRVLVVGGNLSVQGSATATTLIYDAAANAWTSGPTMTTAYWIVAAVKLGNGQVLAVGDSQTAVNLIDVAAGTSVATGSLPEALGYPALALLASGDVLVVGARYSGTPSMQAYRYSPSSGTWSAAATPPSSLYFDAPGAVRLADGRVLVTSATTGAIYDPVANSWSSTAAPPTSRNRHQLVLLPDGRAAAVGDWQCGTSSERTIDLYTPPSNSWTTISTSAAHNGGAAVMLGDNRTLLVAGGYGCPGPSNTSTVELYDTQFGSWGSSEWMSDGRSYLTATRLSDGRVVLAGGRGGYSFNTYVSPNADVYAVPGAVTAAYSSSSAAPLCGYPATSCSTGTLVNGRRTLGPEPHYPNTLAASSCADGSSGVYHSDESLDAVRVIASGGQVLQPNQAVTVEADVWAWAGYTSDKLDIFVAANADAPSWTLVTTLTPTKAGASTMSAQLTLPSTGAQRMAVRAQFRYLGSAVACTTGGFDDRDDVVFGVNAPFP
ncbi:MAG TPA: kelch repeat-containing protein, partial [Myxococcales bacterium]|nr:kelch repeat-containing protein [Myxococcales bacterium]